MKKVFALFVTVVLLSSVFALEAFADNHGSDEAMVRIAHASPDAPAVDVYVNGEAVVEGAAFKDATDYLNLPAGDHEVAIYPADANGEGDPVISTTLTIEAGMAYTVAAVGMLENLALEVATDSMEVSDGMTKVRVGHLSPDAPTVDVGLIGGDALFSGASFPAITDYQELEAGTYDLEIRTEDGTQVLDLSGTTLEANTVYSVFAVNTADNLEAWVLTDYTAMPSEMPQTGMGGAQSGMNTMLMTGLGAMLAGVLLAGFAFNRRRSHQS
ncbi:DUF4397 domain-containing protein [Salimicrobium halophilum]|uniref:DUF4397 domain-containing protein n=1 Tax=Salimicrobium halophilum TaxID=86666 RepID=A0A1G8TYW4_9BACI|nr:DUF4397 domain-containing protein [Salimicrobium halophilum]SDJ46683.1 protein of unknown function [Salimicrobium halophilum]